MGRRHRERPRDDGLMFSDGAVEEPMPAGLVERVMADAGAAAEARRASSPSGRPRRRRVTQMRRAFTAVTVVAVLVVPVLWLVSHHRGMPLTDMARAMENVQSVHFTGEELDSTTGEYVPIEGWAKAPDKLRMRTEGQEEVTDDGERQVTIALSGEKPTVTIERSGKMPGVASGLTYLDLFEGPGAIQSVMESSGMRLVGSEPVTLPDGRAATVLHLFDGGTKALLTVDANTDLLISWEGYDEEGTLRGKIDRIEYNTDIPDSVFQAEIPEGALVIDMLSEPSGDAATEYAKWRKAAYELEAAGGHILAEIAPGYQGTAGGAIHTDLFIRALDKNGMIVVYLPDRNVYRIFGRALVYEGEPGHDDRIVENAEYIPPRPADRTLEQAAAEREAEWRAQCLLEVEEKHQAKAKELQAAGGKLICTLIRGRCSSEYHPALWLKSVDDSFITACYFPDRNAYYVVGKALLYGPGFEKTVEDGWVKVPWPPVEPKEEE